MSWKNLILSLGYQKWWENSRLHCASKFCIWCVFLWIIPTKLISTPWAPVTSCLKTTHLHWHYNKTGPLYWARLFSCFPQIPLQPKQICLHLTRHLSVITASTLTRRLLHWRRGHPGLVSFGPALAAKAGGLDSTVLCINAIPTQSNDSRVLLGAKLKNKSKQSTLSHFAIVFTENFYFEYFLL